MGFYWPKAWCADPPPLSWRKAADWYTGSADAVYQNLNYINEHNPDLVLIISGDHIYRMDYTALFDFHLEKKADVTVAFTKVLQASASRFGLGVIDRKGRLVEYREKPVEPVSPWASMTVYIFKKEILYDLLKANVKEPSHEFGRDIITKALTNCKIFGFKFRGFWEYSQTIEAYYAANMLLLKKKSKFDLKTWEVRTNLYERNRLAEPPPCIITNTALVKNSIISDGCLIKGKIFNSILSPGVQVDKESTVTDSIIMHDSRIGRNAVVKNTICDKDISIGEGVICGEDEEAKPNKDYPSLLSCGITVIGKGAAIPEGTKIGQNCLIYPDVDEGCFGKSFVNSGESVRGIDEEE